MSAAKRLLDDAAIPQRRRRTEGPRLSATFEHQSNIGRLTGIVHSTLPLNEAPQCTVESGEKSAAVTVTHPECDPLVVDVPWPMQPGVFGARADGGAYIVSLSAARSTSSSLAGSTLWSRATACRPTSLACALCGSEVAHFDMPAYVRPLPADSWEELVDAWMCHGDQRLNRSVLQGREGIGASNMPAQHDLWLSRVVAKMASSHLRGTTRSPDATAGPWEVRTDRTRLSDQQKASMGILHPGQWRCAALWLILRVQQQLGHIRRGTRDVSGSQCPEH